MQQTNIWTLPPQHDEVKGNKRGVRNDDCVCALPSLHHSGTPLSVAAFCKSGNKTAPSGHKEDHPEKQEVTCAGKSSF